ncbi:ATP-grasp enzyme, D-alanine-D-alanine ligase [Desulfosarcina cetonica]|uniref:D-alanine--D-alanine ligase family protein n=1 Tax=Desulfosarcina cetonica TaxID=90730 RepID=UPI0006D0D464|nr:D-alanine--D-alanine ligase [Desulfosarcina cetonica]VTR64984.1 ATP-grasp enzyme, D-alanine-D-alanine ligase [Desulfosarcina cetonica]
MRVAIVHDTVADTDAPDARDVLAQADAVAVALDRLGHTVCRVSCSLNLAALRTFLEERRIDRVFNLVESIGGQGRLIHLAPFCFDAMGLPYTGAPAEAMLLTSNKTLAKGWMMSAGIPTPAWIGPWPGGQPMVQGGPESPATWIVKSVWEHASIGLGPESLIDHATADTVFGSLAAHADRLGGACFAEAFIAGREFNLSLLAGENGPVVLPPAEIIFEGYTADMPRIVDYRAKWDETAFEYHHTPRRFEVAPSDRQLVEQMKTLALACWERFGLAGYARVDFRVDAKGRPFVLEINANPCIAPDAGFAAALEQAGIPFEAAIARILADAG